jgi:hypothetical protein
MVIFSTVLGIARGVPKLGRFSETPNLLIYVWIAEERGICQITVPACHSQSAGKLAVSVAHAKPSPIELLTLP